MLVGKDPSLSSMITDKNMDRLKKLYDKQQNQNNYQSGQYNQSIFNFAH
jgi:hypothetical protein